MFQLPFCFWSEGEEKVNQYQRLYKDMAAKRKVANLGVVRSYNND